MGGVGRKSHTQEHGGQGTLREQRAAMAKLETKVAVAARNDEVRKALERSQTNEAMRKARQYLPKGVDRLNKLIHDKETSASAVNAMVKTLAEIGYPKAVGGKGGGGGGGGGAPTALKITLLNFTGSRPAEELTVPVMPTKSLPAVTAEDDELDITP